MPDVKVPISERLRATGGKGQGGPIKEEAADVIDAYATALEWIAESPHTHPANMVAVAKDALARGRK